jgi:hypothetical protein
MRGRPRMTGSSTRSTKSADGRRFGNLRNELFARHQYSLGPSASPCRRRGLRHAERHAARRQRANEHPNPQTPSPEALVAGNHRCVLTGITSWSTESRFCTPAPPGSLSLVSLRLALILHFPAALYPTAWPSFHRKDGRLSGPLADGRIWVLECSYRRYSRFCRLAACFFLRHELA